MTMKRDITVDGKISLVSGVRRFFMITAIIFSAILALGGCYPPFPGNTMSIYSPYDPIKYYQADFNAVWDAAIVTLHRKRYIIDLMSKGEGYISAHREVGDVRYEVGIRVSNAGDLVRISIALSIRIRTYRKEAKSYVWISRDSEYETEMLHQAIASLLKLEPEQTKSQK